LFSKSKKTFKSKMASLIGTSGYQADSIHLCGLLAAHLFVPKEYPRGVKTVQVCFTLSKLSRIRF